MYGPGQRPKVGLVAALQHECTRQLVQLEVMRLFDSPPVPAPGLGGVARSEWWDTFSFHGIVRLLSESVPPPPLVDADRLPANKIVLAARLRKELRDDLSYDRTASIEDACGRYAGLMTRVDADL